MKSKYGGESKQNKVKLTDLCPEEKAKIGELIRTLEEMKNENLSLKHEMKDLKATMLTMNSDKERSLQANSSLERELHVLEQQIEQSAHQNALK